MTYKGQEIGTPTLGLIQECITQWKLRVSAQDVYDYWTSRNWLTKKGQAVKTLESACNVANSVFVQRERKGVNNNISKSAAFQQAKNFIDRNLDTFIQSVSTIKEYDPQRWLGIKSRLDIIG